MLKMLEATGGLERIATQNVAATQTNTRFQADSWLSAVTARL